MVSSDHDEPLESHGAGIGQSTTVVTRIREWFLVDGSRLYVATVISLSIFVLFLLLNELGIIAFVNDDSVTRLAGGMIAGTFSLVTLVVSINQLILSQEFVTADEARQQLQGVMDFRGDVSTVTDVPASPASPTKFLSIIVATIHDHAQTLADAVDPDTDEGALITKYTDRLEESSERINDTLEETSFGTFEAVSAAVAYNGAWQLYAARQIQGRYDESLSDDASNALEELINSLELFITAREHFKTTYLQRELTKFSQLTIYCGVPAILSAMTIGFIYADFGGPTLHAIYLPYVISGLIAIVASPLALLVSYILRTATVTRRTASVGPMIPQKDPESGPFDVSAGQQSE
ncbi:hypothetical protein [Natronolimnobius baerhuensis]|uniref:Uncharacterized protein n=1 Tax=Natronolimnobius baerhuensis TaxID=253108 RepID=A0A202E6R9_9EURY|nr:hypothetical protein [Natronolimnobius baerhuensis]OVE83963.1 hypothetical protein B2G88_16280 [Natronolimnobius baerhuensis]